MDTNELLELVERLSVELQEKRIKLEMFFKLEDQRGIKGDPDLCKKIYFTKGEISSTENVIKELNYLTSDTAEMIRKQNSKRREYI